MQLNCARSIKPGIEIGFLAFNKHRSEISNLLPQENKLRCFKTNQEAAQRVPIRVKVPNQISKPNYYHLVLT